MDIHTFKTKKSYENFPIFFLAVYRVRSAVIDRNFMQIEEHSSTVKNQQIRVTVFCRINGKGLIIS
jgi:hypothetical protein